MNSFPVTARVCQALKGQIEVTATDPTNNINAQVRMGGKLFADACSTIGAGGLVNQSGNPLTGNFDSNKGFQRWGDTSSMSLQTSGVAWSLNNSVANANNWGTRWDKMSQ